jgi:hypothetical protein
MVRTRGRLAGDDVKVQNTPAKTDCCKGLDGLILPNFQKSRKNCAKWKIAGREGWLAPASTFNSLNLEQLMKLRRGQATLPDLQFSDS